VEINFDQKVVEKYKKIRTLALQGVDGESSTAQGILLKLERKHPGIKQYIEAEEARKNPPAGDRPHWSDLWKSQQSQSWQDKIKNFGEAASGAFEWASHFAGQAFSVREAQVLAQNAVKVTTKDHQTGAMACNIRIPPEIAQRICAQFSDEQLTVFVNTLSQRVASELFFHIAGEEIPVDDPQKSD
jgi:hypothetical protein